VHHLGHLRDARAGRAAHQHIGARARRLPHAPPQRLGQIRSAEDHPRRRIAGLELRLEAAVLQHKCPVAERARQHREQLLGRAGLFEEVEGPLAHGLDRHRNVALAGEQYHRQVGIHRTGVGQQVKPVAPRHPDIRQDHAGKIGGDMVLGLDEGARRAHLPVRQFQRLHQRLAHRAVIVHNEHGAAHAARSSDQGSSSIVNSAPQPVLAPAMRPPKLCTSP